MALCLVLRFCCPSERCDVCFVPVKSSFLPLRVTIFQVLFRIGSTMPTIPMMNISKCLSILLSWQYFEYRHPAPVWREQTRLGPLVGHSKLPVIQPVIQQECPGYCSLLDRRRQGKIMSSFLEVETHLEYFHQLEQMHYRTRLTDDALQGANSRSWVCRLRDSSTSMTRTSKSSQRPPFANRRAIGKC